MDKALLEKIRGVVEEAEGHGDAIRQLESDTGELSRQVTKMRQQRAGARDGNDRGIFESQEQARSFGYYMLSQSRDADMRAMGQRGLESDSYGRAMASNPDSAGGGMVPHEFSARLKLLVERHGTFIRNCFRMPMKSDSLTFPKQVGELEVFCPGEGQAATVSDPKFNFVNLVSKDWVVLSYAPRNLVDDSIVEIAELVFLSMARAYAHKADKIGFTGDGTKDSFGIRGIIPKLLELNDVDDGGGLVLGAGNEWSELLLTDFEKVQGRLPEVAGVVEPKWYCSRPFYYNVMVRLMLAAGGVTAEEIEGRRRRVFLSDPVELVQVMPKTQGNSQICALYGDLRMAATYGDRQQMKVEESRDYKFAERLIAFMGTERLAISVEDLGTATEAGPIVGLITAAS